jgi:hypothetical protein
MTTGNTVTIVSFRGFRFRFIDLSMITLFGLIMTCLLIYADKLEQIPTLWIALLAMLFSYSAYLFSKDRFRLDLLDRRFELYEKTLEFCSIVFSHGSLKPTDQNNEQIERAIKAAHESFRGIGCHKARALFGDDIYELFQSLNKSFSHIMTYQHIENRDQMAYWGHVTHIADMTSKLPDHFKPYVYFGDYKAD